MDKLYASFLEAGCLLLAMAAVVAALCLLTSALVLGFQWAGYSI